MGRETVIVGEGPLRLEQLAAVALGRAQVALSGAPELRERLERSRAALRAAMEQGRPVYGFTTGFGRSATNSVNPDYGEQLGLNLLRYHGCGSGEALGEAEVRGAMLCRLLCFARGYSSVSVELLEQLVAFLEAGITPVVPAQGSVGASGDLTPMSYVAAALSGEREVFQHGRRMPASEALQAAGLAPHRLQLREPLAMLNGTPIMTGIAIVAVEQARHILDAAIAGTALAVHGMAGNGHHFHRSLFEAKPFPGSRDTADRLRRLLARDPAAGESTPPAVVLQDPYSLRCAPQILGVLEDALAWITGWVETEANGVSDNPLLDPESGEVVMGGNFYGGHMGFAMDGLKTALSSLADMADRQIALLVDPSFNRGLPADLVPAAGNGHHVNHGFKALQITASALTAEALQASLPATIFSRSTESHNQDKVSMGTTAARDALRVSSLAARVAAAQLMVAAQAAELRGELTSRPALGPLLAAVRALSAPLGADRPLDVELARVAAAITAGTLLPRGVGA